MDLGRLSGQNQKRYSLMDYGTVLAWYGPAVSYESRLPFTRDCQMIFSVGR